jgi:plastocyanin
MRSGAVSLVGALVLAGCSTPSQEPGVSADGLRATVLMEDRFFEPVNITVKAGATVTWRNAGDLSHTATSDEPGGPLDSGTIAPDGSYEATLRAPGIYHYHCVPHVYRNSTSEPWQGMVGSIVVR